MKKISLLLISLFVADLTFADANQSSQASKESTATKTAAAPAVKKKPAPKAASVSLETAYKREYAFLAAQKKELEKRIQSYKTESRKEQNKVEAEISQLEQSTVNNSALIENLEQQLAEAERQDVAMSERSEVLDMTFTQAGSTLKGYGIEVIEQDSETEVDNAARLTDLYQKGLALMTTLGVQREEKGKFFLQDGKEAEGTIVRIGNIAAYGISEKGSGVLAPAGGGQFKLWKEPAENEAKQLSKGEQPDTLKVFLYESLNKVVEEKAEKTWLSIVESGGVIGWIIVVLGAFGMVFVLIRCYLLFINSRDTKSKTEEVMEKVREGEIQDAEDCCNNESCAITRVMSSTLRHLKDDRDHMEDVIGEAILNESGAINRFGSTILVIASVAPLLGLLGTVTGMISTFDIITEFGTGDPKLLSSGISVALVTTQLGLIVAIPTLLCGSLLSAWATNIKRDMEKSALMITNSVLGGGNEEVVNILKEQQDAGVISTQYKTA